MVTRVRTKICGITSVEDALCAVNAGADAIGLVFYGPSPRNVSLKQAKAICAALPPFVSVVALVVDRPREEIQALCDTLPISLLQFHGDEADRDCTGFGLPYIKAIRVRSADDVRGAADLYPGAQGILVDAYVEGVAGGTGQTFDWSLLPGRYDKPLILAGGLNPANVRNAISQVKPYAVDVSGGVEREKGIKDHKKIVSFINEVLCGCENK